MSSETNITDYMGEDEASFEDLEDLQTEFQTKANKLAAEMQREIDALQQELETKQEQLESQLETLPDENWDTDQLEDFVEKPYTLIPKSENEMWVIVPRFIPFNVGWLEKQDESYNHFIVNKYVNWIEEIPDEISEEVGIEQEFEEAQIEDGVVQFSDEDERDRAWDKLGGREGGLYKRTDEDKIQVKAGKEFDVIAELIEQGNLPFTPTPVEQSDLRSDITGVSLREYQERAWNKLRETGMIGVYWPPGTGKTFLGLYAGDRIRGKKLVVVPQKTLEEQWNERIEEFCDHPEEWDVRTYQYLSRQDNIEEYNKEGVKLTIMDECQTLPSRTYSKISTINTKYRIGLSATPYREEDGTTKYIFALTGYPVGLNWNELKEKGVTRYPDVKVLLHRTQRQKRKTVEEYINKKTGKIVVFCDSIDEGKKLSEDLDIPFIHGETDNRMDKFRNNRVVISSRVGDEGMSLDDINVVIEYDFHGRSRRQELQRAGRIMHNDSEDGEHYILMTDDEHEKYSRRLLSLEQKGFKIEKVRKK